MAWQTLGKQLFNTARSEIPNEQVSGSVCRTAKGMSEITCNYCDMPESWCWRGR